MVDSIEENVGSVRFGSHCVLGEVLKPGLKRVQNDCGYKRPPHPSLARISAPRLRSVVGIQYSHRDFLSDHILNNSYLYFTIYTYLVYTLFHSNSLYHYRNRCHYHYRYLPRNSKSNTP